MSALPAQAEETPAPLVSSTSVPTIASEYPDYPPGSPVRLTGTGWVGATDTEPAETVTIVVNDTIGQTWSLTDTTSPDTNGDLTYEFTLPDYFVSDYDVTATGSIPYPDGEQRVATATFTDAQGSFSKPYAHWSDEPLPGDWNNNILNDNKSNYFEGEVIPHVWMYGASNQEPLVNGESYSFNVTYNWYQQNTDAGGFAYMTQYNLSRQPSVFDWATPAVTPTVDSAFTNGGGMAVGADFYSVDADITGISDVTYTGTGTKDGHVTITFTYTGTTTSNGYAAVYYGLYIAKPGEVPDQGAGKTNGASAWSGGSLQTTVDIGGSGATSIQLAPSAIIAGEISGLKFNDLNANGTKDEGEPGLAGWVICLDNDSDSSNGDLGCVQTSDGTTDDQDGDGVIDPLGFYYFSVTPGEYYVYEVNQIGWTQTAPSSVHYGPLVVSATTATYLDQDFGNSLNTYTLQVEKTAAGTYDETHTWDVEKTVTPPSQSGFAGDTLDWTWTVDVSEASEDSNFAVTGTISITNPSPFEVPFSVSDALNDDAGTVGVVDCDPDTEGDQNSGTLAGGDSVECSYTAQPADGSATLNEATVTTDHPYVSGGTATADVSFTANVIDGTATVTDDAIGLNEELTAGAGPWTWTGPGEHTCSLDSAAYNEEGSYSGQADNEAVVTGSDGQSDSDSASTTYYCFLPTAAKTAVGSYDLRWTWDVEKTVDPGTQSGFAGETLPWTWTVTVSETSAPENFQVAGDITITNPNPYSALTVSDIADVVSGGGDDVTAAVTCDADLPFDVPSGGSVSCTYSTSVDNDGYDTNTVTVTTNHGEYSDTEAVAWDADPTNVYNDTATLSDPDAGLDESLAAGDEGQRVFTAPGSHVCSSDAGEYGEESSYSGAVTNEATVTGSTGQSDTAQSTTGYYCYIPVVSKTAEGTYAEDHSWTVDKSVDPTSQDAFAGETVDYTWEVVVTESVTESGFQASGDVTVTNPNPEDAMTVSLSDVLSDGTVGVITSCVIGDDTDDPSDGLTVPAGASAVCAYTANVEGLDDVANAPESNTATVTLNDLEYTASAAIDWSTVPSTDSVRVTDEQIGLDQVISDGDTFTALDSYTCSSEAADYADDGTYSYSEDNTASIYAGEEAIGSADASTTVDCYGPVVSKTADGTYDERHEWDVEKTVDPGSQSGFAGETVDFTWTVTVTESVFEENFDVAGEITVVNPAPMPMSVSLADLLNDGTVGVIGSCTNEATFADGTLTIPADTTTVCGYTAEDLAYADDADAPDSNTATATLNGIEFSASDGIGWVATVIRGEAVVIDDQGPLNETVTGSDSWTIEDTYECSTDQTKYTSGYTYSETVWNTAVVTSEEVVQDESMTSTQIDCYVPDVSKTASGAYIEEHTWDIDKSVDPSSQDAFAGDTVSYEWEVVVDETVTEKQFVASGTISVRNPNPEDAMTVDLSDQLSDGTVVTILTCEDGSVTDDPSDGLTVEPGKTMVCGWTASLDISSVADAPDKNTATAVLNEQQYKAEASIVWTPDVLLPEVDVTDNQIGLNETVDGDETFTATETYMCSTDVGAYPQSGTYTFSEYNTASISAGGEALASASADTSVNCYLWDVTKTAEGTYQDEYGWTIDKTVDPESQSGAPGDTLEWTWSITWESVFEQEINHQVTGVITVTNPAPLELTVDVTDYLTGDFAATVTCSDDDGGTDLTVAANGEGTCTYSADPGSQLAQNTATATRNTVAVSETVNVNWAKTGDVGLDAEISDSSNVDIPVGSEQPFTYTDSATCSTVAGDYGESGTYSGGASNTATITWTEGSDSSTASTTYDCNASFVEIEKRTNGGVDPSLDIRFRLYDAEGTDLNDEVTTLNDADGLLQFATALRPGDTYTVCEFPVPAAYTFEIKDGDGNYVSTYSGPPGTEAPTGEVQCFDFTAAASPETLTFYVNNRYPGGAPRTPGYWKNWSTCSGGNQAETAAKLNAAGMEVFILDDLLPRTVGNLVVETCDVGVLVLDSRWAIGNKAGKQASNDAGYELARNFLAADLNVQAGACQAPGTWQTREGAERTFTQVMADAQAFLVEIGYDGAGDLLTSRMKSESENRQYALYLAGLLDDYNNGLLCNGTPSH